MSQLISVIGAGTMGSGIAQVAASNGCQVTIVDSSQPALENSKSKLKSILNRLVEKGKINEEQSKSILACIHWTAKMDEISNSNMVIEAIVENLEIKQQSNFLDGVKDGSWVYFVHSYRIKPKNAGFIVAETDYGIKVPAVIEQKNFIGTQFHPEKSGEIGSLMLRNFLSECKK